MANVKGGKMTGRHLVGSVTYFPAGTTDQGKQYAEFFQVDAQLDLRAEENKPQTNPHLHDHKFTAADGQTKTTHKLRMTRSQVDAIRKGSKVSNVDGESFEFGCIADLQPASEGGLVIKTDTVKKTDLPFKKDTLAAQAKTVADLKAKAKAEREADAKAPAEPEAPQSQAQTEAPALG